MLLTLISVAAASGLAVLAHQADRGVAGSGARAMSPAQARDDKVAGLSGCHVSFGAVAARPASGCTFGDPQGKVTVALVGDSHAQHWFPALDALAKQRGWRLYEWSKDSCAVNDAPEYLDVYARPYPECAQ